MKRWSAVAAPSGDSWSASAGTQTASNRLRPPGKGGAPPLVRWAISPRGRVEPAVPTAPELRPGAVPTTANRGGEPKAAARRQRRGHRSHFWRSLQFSRCYLGAANRAIEANQLVALVGGAGLEARLRQVGGRPATDASPLPVLLSLLHSGRKSKEPLPYGSGSNGHGPVEVQFRPLSMPPWEGACHGRRRRAT
jgi:hypothetical protein